MPEDKIKVLVVDDIPETRENLKKLLYFEDDIEVIGAADSGEKGVEMAKELKPNVVLMDINMPGIDGIKASELIFEAVPGIQVIMMSVQSEADYLRRSMLAGAREFLIKPFSSEELSTSLRRVYERRAPAPVAAPAMPMAPAPAMAIKQGQIISVYSPKGGVGCSTLATNLALALHEVSKSEVALMDASLQFGDIAVMLNVQSSSSIADFGSQTDAIDTDLLNEILSTHPTGVRVLLAPPKPEMAELITAEQVETILTRLVENYDFVIVDTPSAMNDVVLSILDLSDLILLMMEAEIPVVKSVNLFMEVAEALDYPKEKISLVLNRADRRTGIKAQDIEANLKQAILIQVPRDERLATMAVNTGKPILMTQRNNAFSQSILELARVLTRRLGEQEGAKKEVSKRERGGGLFGRILGRE